MGTEGRGQGGDLAYVGHVWEGGWARWYAFAMLTNVSVSLSICLFFIDTIISRF